VSLAAQLRSTRFHPWLYWTVILTTSTAGTTVSDFMDVVTARVRSWQLAAGEFGAEAAITEEARQALTEALVPMQAYSMVGSLLNMVAANVRREGTRAAAARQSAMPIRRPARLRAGTASAKHAVRTVTGMTGM